MKAREANPQTCSEVMVEHDIQLVDPAVVKEGYTIERNSTSWIEAVLPGQVMVRGIVRKELHYTSALLAENKQEQAIVVDEFPFSCVIPRDDANEGDRFEITGCSVLGTVKEAFSQLGKGTKEDQDVAYSLKGLEIIKVCIRKEEAVNKSAAISVESVVESFWEQSAVYDWSLTSQVVPEEVTIKNKESAEVKYFISTEKVLKKEENTLGISGEIHVLNEGNIATKDLTLKVNLQFTKEDQEEWIDVPDTSFNIPIEEEIFPKEKESFPYEVIFIPVQQAQSYRAVIEVSILNGIASSACETVITPFSLPTEPTSYTKENDAAIVIDDVFVPKGLSYDPIDQFPLKITDTNIIHFERMVTNESLSAGEEVEIKNDVILSSDSIEEIDNFHVHVISDQSGEWNEKNTEIE